MQREFEALLDMQRFDAGELDYAVLDRHVARLTQLSQVVNSGITVFDMYRRRHVFSSYNFPDLFRYDMDRIASEDSDYFSARIHPDDLPDVHRNGIDCLRCSGIRSRSITENSLLSTGLKSAAGMCGS